MGGTDDGINWLLMSSLARNDNDSDFVNDTARRKIPFYIQCNFIRLRLQFRQIFLFGFETK